MNNFVRDALDAATRAACACECATVQPGCVTQVAEEIEVFLRALPEPAEGDFARFAPSELVKALLAEKQERRT